MASQQPVRRLAAICFADVAGFTRLTAGDEPLAFKVVAALRVCARAAVDGNGGSVVKFLGDGVMAEFASVEGAVAAALELRESFRHATDDLPGGPYHLYLGVNLGEVTVADDGDLFGDGVNRAARLQEMAALDQILVGEEVQRLLRQRPDYLFSDAGVRTAKGLEEPFRVFAVEPSPGYRNRLTRTAALVAEGRPGSRTVRAAILWFRLRAVRLGRHARRVGGWTGAAVVGLATLVAVLGIWSIAATPGDAEHTGGPDTSFRAPLPDRSETEAADAAREEAEDAAATAEADPNDPADPGGPSEQSEPDESAPRTTVDDSEPLRQLDALATAANARLGATGPSIDGWPELLPLVRRAADVVRSGQALPEDQVHTLRGLLLFASERRWDEAEAAFQAALDADSTSTATRRFYAYLLAARGQPDAALRQLDRAEAEGTPSEELRRARASVLLRSGRLGDARSELERLFSAAPSDLAVRVLLARARSVLGQHAQARGVLMAPSTQGSVPAMVWTERIRLASTGDGAESPRLDELAEGAADMVISYPLALMHLAAGRRAEAFRHLDRAIDAGSPDVVWLGVDPEWAPVHDDPRYQERLARVTSGAD